MTRDIISMAKEAGIRDCTCNGKFGCLDRFAALVAAAAKAEEREEMFQKNAPAIASINAHMAALKQAVIDEREACAAIAETPVSGEQDNITMEAKDRVASAIRARGQA